MSKKEISPSKSSAKAENTFLPKETETINNTDQGTQASRSISNNDEGNVIIEFYGRKTNTIWIKKNLTDDNEEISTDSNAIIGEDESTVYKPIKKEGTNN